jgi:hypothetical protein
VFVRAGALIPLAPEYDSLNPSFDQLFHVPRRSDRAIMPTAPPAPTFTLADGAILT